jgi:hypothetical protein
MLTLCLLVLPEHTTSLSGSFECSKTLPRITATFFVVRLTVCCLLCGGTWCLFLSDAGLAVGTAFSLIIFGVGCSMI